jgi:uncharacterized protein YeaO (DUF488 family)
MSERFNVPDSKSGVLSKVPGVRIPLSPPSPAVAGYGGQSPLKVAKVAFARRSGLVHILIPLPMAINLKRIYEPYTAADGYRILVDRLWPRGVKKEGAHIDKWLKEVAPSTALRKWFDHDPGKWEQFRIKYHTELNGSPAFKELLADINQHHTITLLYAAKDEQYNQAVVLQQFINSLSV